jgi:hypothetical protein
MNKIFVNNIGDLAEAQRASFSLFFMYRNFRRKLIFPNPFITKIKVSGRKSYHV